MTSPRLEARHASKTYGAATVLDDAHLVVEPGEIHALVGQNGSGKSTLVKILTGYHAPDRGMELAVDGKPLSLPVQWRAAQAAGLAVVHQDMGLIGHLTVSENIGVGNFVCNRWTGRINWKRQAQAARETLERLQLDIDPLALVDTLPASHRAAVAIARALRGVVPGEGLLLLDEATRSLPRSELAHVHDLMKRVAASGTSILMVSHSLEEVLGVSDKVTVLRDGKVAGAGVPTTSLTEADLARLMLGKTVNAVSRDRECETKAKVVAQINQLQLMGGHEPLDIVIREGEIVGITGLPGTGFEQLPYFLGGSRRCSGTLVTDAGRVDLRRTSVEQCMGIGVAVVPERRIDEGLAVDLSIRDNLALPSINRLGKPWFVAKGWQDSLTEDSIKRFDIKARGGEDLVRELSGGNQQKVLFAKWLSTEPSLLILHEPTQAVDVGARADLLGAICTTAATGRGVLLISTEPTDLVETCDRILVIHPGRKPVELRTDNPDDVLDAVYSVAESAPIPATAS
ncbi:sugar ABC transporter ATP-binding protein [Nocardioides sp. Iso805N]|uniref:sugar ABC transporter ATP-binding protein n=1 Tax=Nocardioides sp. Iso805N TaxID=1283287 RepID=UPI000373ADDA|nr:sugar ABC transporter ATP-binding protein [Nocardioides sp. Iso805N]